MFSISTRDIPILLLSVNRELQFQGIRVRSEISRISKRVCLNLVHVASSFASTSVVIVCTNIVAHAITRDLLQDADLE